MAERRTPLELSVERTVRSIDTGASILVRLSATIVEGEEAPAEERGRVLAQMLDELEGMLRATPGIEAPQPRPDRSVAELIEVYHPRQRELVDLLALEGELTPQEADRLRGFLDETPVPAPQVSQPEFSSATGPRAPIAAAPLASDRSPSVARPIEELLDRFEIRSLKQAGAVRARRQISYEEYMALKRHFAQSEGTPGEAPRSPPSA